MAKTIYEQTGWKRPYPKMILMHNTDLLEKITDYDYNMTNLDFVRYAFSRGCMNGAFLPTKNDPSYTIEVEYWEEQALNAYSPEARKIAEGTLSYLKKSSSKVSPRKYVTAHSLSKEDFLSEEFYFVTGKVIPLDHKERLWPCIVVARGHLQDCWEVLMSEHKEEKKAVGQTLLF